MERHKLKGIAYSPEERIETLEENQKELGKQLMEAIKVIEELEDKVENLEEELEEAKEKETITLDIEMPREAAEQSKEESKEVEEETNTTQTEASDKPEKPVLDGYEPGDYSNLTSSSKKRKIKQFLNAQDDWVTTNQIAAYAFEQDANSDENHHIYRNLLSQLKDLRARDVIETDDTGFTYKHKIKPKGTEELEEATSLEEKPEQKPQGKKELFQTLDSFTDDTAIGIDTFSVSEREEKILDILEDSEIPLSVAELTRLVYQLPESVDVSFGTAHRNRVNAAVYNLRDRNEVQKSDEDRVEVNSGSMLLELAEEPELEEVDEEEPEEIDEEQLEENRINKVRSEADVTQSDFDILVNGFEKLVNDREEKYINFQNFEQVYTGDESPMKMFRKLFSNSELLTAVMNQVTDKQFTWKKKKSGAGSSGIKTWVIEIEP